MNETDHGTWRRLALLQFPYIFRKPGEPIQGERERPGDPTLKTRIKINNDCQHDAIVTWAVEGAMKWYADPETSLRPTDKINSDTRRWRAEADRIIAFWDEKLIADRNFGIVSTDIAGGVQRLVPEQRSQRVVEGNLWSQIFAACRDPAARSCRYAASTASTARPVRMGKITPTAACDLPGSEVPKCL